ncbi:hypothetical protein T265_07151 [Opisthorchis viverrini]|uniref:Uncharacterized protein n=1 Tax=Opisthorchis viverrini TaxID=6198 RepID=A0A074ZI03_OPIVI|nr:hypothetical protein T265_07151 [Opisthorchis viverrini]KER25412.1 hypothetical protein T265_07151 [Opisthorchis viverrini]
MFWPQQSSEKQMSACRRQVFLKLKGVLLIRESMKDIAGVNELKLHGSLTFSVNMEMRYAVLQRRKIIIINEGLRRISSYNQISLWISALKFKVRTIFFWTRSCGSSSWLLIVCGVDVSLDRTSRDQFKSAWCMVSKACSLSVISAEYDAISLGLGLFRLPLRDTFCLKTTLSYDRFMMLGTSIHMSVHTS